MYDGFSGAYLYVVQTMPSGTIAKHHMAFGNDTNSWIVTGAYPYDSGSDLTNEFLKAIMSIKLQSSANVRNLGGDVDFTLSAPTLKLTPGWNRTIVFTKGEFPNELSTDPFYRAMPALKKMRVLPNDRAEFALTQIRPSPHIEVKKVSIDREIEVDGLYGREIVALAHDHSNNTPILLYSAVLFEETSHVAIHAWCGQHSEGDWVTEFKAITRSFRRTGGR